MSTPVLKVPPFQMDVGGEYQGNAYPEQREYRVHMIEGDDDTILFSVEDSSGGEVTTKTLTSAEAEGIIQMAGTDHSIDAYGDVAVPSGFGRTITWDVGAYSDYVVLSEGHIDEVAAWLRYATGLDEWDNGTEWVY